MGGGEQDLEIRPLDENPEPAVVWSFAASVRFTGSAHERTLLPRQCLTYSRTWPTTSQDGSLVPAGLYELTPYSLASARNGVAWSRDDQRLISSQVEVVD